MLLFFFIKGCDNHNPACAKQCFSPNAMLVFASFSGFSFPGLCCFVNWEFMGNYSHKTVFPLIFTETKNIDLFHLFFFRFFRFCRQRNFCPVRIIQEEIFRCDAQDHVCSLSLCINIILRCPISSVRHRKQGRKHHMQYFMQK